MKCYVIAARNSKNEPWGILNVVEDVFIHTPGVFKPKPEDVAVRLRDGWVRHFPEVRLFKGVPMSRRAVVNDESFQKWVRQQERPFAS